MELSRRQDPYMSTDNVHNVKVVIVGDVAVGKTSLAVRFKRDTFDDTHQGTIPATFITKVVTVRDDVIQFQIWDTSGQECYSCLVPIYLRGANVALLVYDVTDPASFTNAAVWLKRLRLDSGLIRTVLVANKVDLPARVDVQVARAYAKSNGLMFVATSARTGFNVEEMFEALESAVTLGREVSTPPLRPPLPALDQSDHGLSSSSQSNHSSVDPSPDDCFSNGQSCRFPSGGNQSDAADDDTPPVLPPSMKARKQQEADASIHRDFMESMKQLNDCGWFWGPLSPGEAAAKLANKPVGSFLVRDSSNKRYILSLSLRHHVHVYHCRIEHHQGHFIFGSEPDSRGKSTIKDFVEQFVDESRNGLLYIKPTASPQLRVPVLHPVSRFIQMRSLQHMCRFRIVQLMRRDHINCLPIPTRIKNYLKEAQYYVEYLDD